MTQRDLDSAVASATGEDVREIRRRGFSVIDLRQRDFDPRTGQPSAPANQLGRAGTATQSPLLRAGVRAAATSGVVDEPRRHGGHGESRSGADIPVCRIGQWLLTSQLCSLSHQSCERGSRYAIITV